MVDEVVERSPDGSQIIRSRVKKRGGRADEVVEPFMERSWSHGTGWRTRVGAGVKATWKVGIPANKGRGWKTRDWGFR